MRVSPIIAMVGGIGIAWCFAYGQHQANATSVTGISAEGVSSYSYYRAEYSNTTGDIDGASEASGFYTTMTTTSGTPWTQLNFWTEGNVWDTDFYDPDASGLSYDNDNNEFDPGYTPAAIGFVMAHGSCDDAVANTCSTTSDCPSGLYCMGNPPSAHSSMCGAGYPRRIVTSSASSSHGNYVFYDNGTVKWGEDSNSGSWAGAGTNGSLGVVFVVNSCGTRYPFIWDETRPTFAGAMLGEFTMPVSNIQGVGPGDLWAVSWRGSTLASLALANPTLTVTDEWFATQDSIGPTVGPSCPDQTSTYTYGGGYGYAGCAASLSVSYDSTQAAATSHVTSLTWNQARDFSNKSKGTTYGYGLYHCNYDCATYPVTK